MFYEAIHDVSIVTSLRSVAELAGTWLLQSAVLIGIGLAVAWGLATRGAAVQSAVLRATLVAALLSPLATLLLSSFGITGYGMQLPAAWLEAEPRIAESRPARNGAVALSDEQATFGRRPARIVEDREDPANPLSEVAAMAAVPQVAKVEPAAALSASHDAISPVASGGRVGWTPATWALCGGGVLWLGVSLYLLTRLIVSEQRMAQLVRRASPADREVAVVCRRVAGQLGVRPPQVLVSPFLSSPCLVGIWRSKLLLGEQDLTCGTKLREILAHELAHLQRRDCAWQLAHRVTASLLWCQPLLWRLVRRLEQAAEDVCDDVVMHLGADRNRYANMLVGVAELGLPPSSATAVNLVSLRSSLGRRVQRILDCSRTLSTRTSTRVVAGVAAAALCGTLLAGLLGATGQSEGEAAKVGDEQLRTW